MQKLAVGVLVAVMLGACTVFLLPLVLCFAAIGGWAVQWLWPITTTELLTALGLHMALWKIAVGLSFVGHFFRTNVTKSKD